MLGDPNSVRWQDADIKAQLDSSIAWMHDQMQTGTPVTTSQNVTYPDGADYVALPSGIEGDAIYGVEDITDSSNPQYLQYIAPSELENHHVPRVWSLKDGSVAVRPRPTPQLTLRIVLLSRYVPLSGSAAPSTDQTPMPPGQEELLCLMTACALQEVDGESNFARLGRLESLKAEFYVQAARYRGPVYVNRIRSFR